jgi:hypothetical protein
MSDVAQPHGGPAAVEQPGPPEPHGPAEIKPKKVPVTTLLGYLGSRTSAAGFLKNLREAEIWSFAPPDREEALARHRELDPRFTKTASLLAQSLKAKDERHVLPVSEMAREALLERLRDFPRWIGTSWDELSPAQRAVKVADAVSSRFSDSKKGREAQNLLATALLLLGQESLDSEVALRATARALEARAEDTPRWNRERVRFVAGPRAKLPELRVLLQTVLPWIERADAAEAELERAHAAREQEQRRVEAAEATARERAQEISKLEAERDALTQRIEELEDDLQSSRVHGSHNLDRARASSRAFLEGRLLGLLQTAVDALDVEPPRPHIAKEKLEVAREAIEEQMKWLEQ